MVSKCFLRKVEHLRTFSCDLSVDFTPFQKVSAT